MKIKTMRSSPGGFKPGEVHVVGKMPKHVPYVWIGDEQGCLVAIDRRQMNALCNQWARANNASSRPANARRLRKTKSTKAAGG